MQYYLKEAATSTWAYALDSKIVHLLIFPINLSQQGAYTNPNRNLKIFFMKNTQRQKNVMNPAITQKRTENPKSQRL